MLSSSDMAILLRRVRCTARGFITCRLAVKDGHACPELNADFLRGRECLSSISTGMSPELTELGFLARLRSVLEPTLCLYQIDLYIDGIPIAGQKAVTSLEGGFRCILEGWVAPSLTCSVSLARPPLGSSCSSSVCWWRRARCMGWLSLPRLTAC